MFSFKIQEGEIKEITIQCDVKELTADVCCMIYAVYSVLKENDDEFFADYFKETMNEMFENNLIFSTEEEREKKIQKKKNELREKKDKTKEALKNLIDSLARSFDGEEE